MNAEQAIAYIHSVCWKGSKPGLSRTQALLKKMGNPEKKLKFIHVGGTNGKGSTSSMLASVLEHAGYRTGLYTSPYIFRFHERMQVNRCPISDEDLAAVTEYIKPLAESMADTPTEFELVTCVAMEYFARQQCDIVVLEVGMGGELDSTNVIDCPECAILCNIGLDHTAFLGDTLTAIAQTKTGIFKDGGTCVTYPGVPEVEAVYEAVSAQRGLDRHPVDFTKLRSRSFDLSGQRFDFGDRRDLRLPLLGQHQLHNAATALTALDCLIARGWRITEEHIRTGLADTAWPGRFELLRHKPLFIVDGGHNPQCIDALAENIRTYLADRPLTVLTGVMADKDFARMYEPVAPYCARFITVTPPNPRALPAAELAEQLKVYGKPVYAVDDVAAGVEKALELAGPDGTVLAFGSLYMVGDIRAAAMK